MVLFFSHQVWMSVCKRIADLISEAKVAAGIDCTVPLSCLGLSLSGADNAEKQKEISDTLLAKYPQATKHCFTCNDTLSPLVTATDGGGVVLIAGTGSNCLLANPSGLDRKLWRMGAYAW